MNKDTLKGQWNQLIGGMKTQWGKLTNDDWAQVEGSYDKLVGKVQERYGYQKEQAQRDVDDWLARHPEMAGGRRMP
jgi:uncharacterized protein YjbJ (UPF0337 family)